MASPFAKYQSEQVQQIAPGFVEGFAKGGEAIGRGIASVGDSVAKGMQVAEQKKQEEAKIQGMLSPYLKTDPRVQNVKAQLNAGKLKKDDAGNVYIPDEFKDHFDPAKAADAIGFYNQTGGDGSKLTGPALTKFATAFESERKYASEQAGLEDKRIEKLKTLAEIRKMEAESAKMYAGIGNTQIASAFSAGMDMSTFSPAFGTQAPASVLDGTPYANGGAGLASRGTVPQASTGSITSAPAPAGTFTRQPEQFSLTPETSKPPITSTFSPERYQAGRPVVQALQQATPSATASTQAPTPVVAGMPSVVTEPIKPGVTPTDTSAAYLAQIPVLQQARVALDAAYQNETNVAQVNYNLTLSRMNNPDVATLKYLNDAFKTQNDLRAERYKNNVATMGDRLAAFEKSAAEARAAQGASTEALKTTTEYGAPVTPGQKAPETTGKDTFVETVQSRIQSAGAVAGRMGGTKSTELRRSAQEEHNKIMRDYPTWYNVGLTTKGGDEYQLKLFDYPTSAPIDSTIKGKVDESVAGYNQGRTFLTQMLAAVESTDEGAIRNYLDRMLLTTSKDITYQQGEMLNQFGVASFRAAITSGGNFSDQDRLFVQSIITNINSLDPRKDKDKMLAQTKVLAQFIDQRFRSNLAAQGVRLDLKTSREFLTREKDEVGLAELNKAEQFYTAFKINPNKLEISNTGQSAIDPAFIKEQIKVARKNGANDLADRLEKELKQNQNDADAAAKKAVEAAAKARK